MLILLDPLSFHMTVGRNLVVVILASITGPFIGWVIEKHTTRPLFYRGNEVDSELRIVLEAIGIALHIAIILRIHDLASGNRSHEFAERRTSGALTIYLVNFVCIRNEFSFV